MKTETSGPLANRILAALSQADFSRVSPLLEAVSYEQGVLLQEPGDEVEHIHFPHTGIRTAKPLKQRRWAGKVSSGRWLVLDCTLPWREPWCRCP
jgi:hypothetical protein